jgi:uncharacterized membrane protein
MDNELPKTPQHDPKQPNNPPEIQPLAAEPQPVPINQAIIAQILSAQQNGLPYVGGPIMGAAQPRFAVPLQIPSALVAQQSVQIWNGEYPPPEASKVYESLAPGAFDRMMKMAERRLEAQIKETERAQDYTQKDTRRAHWMGAITHVIAVIGALVCVALGVEFKNSSVFWVAGALVGLPVMAVAKSFVDSVKQPSTKDILDAVKPTPPPPTATNPAHSPP